MVKNLNELIEDIRKIVGDNNTDEFIAFVEDLSDTLAVDNAEEVERLKKELEENDKYWRDKYITRFLGGDDDDDTVEIVEEEKPQTYEDLFE